MSARVDHVAEAREWAQRAENPNATKTLTPVGTTSGMTWTSSAPASLVRVWEALGLS